MKNKPFQATIVRHKQSSKVSVINIDNHMGICVYDYNIVIITKQQVMDFWGLVDQGVNINNDDVDQKKCPAINQYCKYYTYQRDRNNDVAICFCNHKENKNEYEGNCTKSLCPILVNNN